MNRPRNSGKTRPPRKRDWLGKNTGKAPRLSLEWKPTNCGLLLDPHKHRFAMQRRQFLFANVGAALGGAFGSLPSSSFDLRKSQTSALPAYSVIPVVGDGKWIWTEPPDGETGYLEPRPYDLSIGIRLQGAGPAGEIMSTTTVPVDHPEQKIESVEIETQGCQAKLRKLADGAGQLLLTAAGISRGQIIQAVARFRLTLFKQYFGYHADQFPARQKAPPDVRRSFLQDSPGIEARSKQVRKLASELTEGTPKHPFEQARTFAEWVPMNIRPQLGSYTSVTAALEDLRGDCEEMAGVFVALCRAVGIPARLVWIPNHTWAEFFLVDHDDKGHWIPAHTACYSWFGWNGAHELVLQKGDRIQVPERRKTVRLLADWTRWSGAEPEAQYTAELTPLPIEPGADAGPGARSKDAKGEWVVAGEHPLNRYVRR